MGRMKHLAQLVGRPIFEEDNHQPRAQSTVQPTSAMRNRERVSNQALYQSIA